MGIHISGLDTWIFFRLTFNQAGGLYIPLITVMMIQVRTFSQVGFNHKTVTVIVMVALMICVVIIITQNLGVTLTTQTTGSFRSFIVELQICNSPSTTGGIPPSVIS